MDRNEVTKMEEFLETEKGKEYVIYMLKYPAIRNRIAGILAEKKSFCKIETVDFLEIILSMSLGDTKISPKIIEEKCNQMKKYTEDDFKFCKNEIFGMLISHKTGIRERTILPSLALLNFDDLKYPGDVCDIIDSIADMAVEYRVYIGNVKSGDVTPRKLCDVDIPEDDEIFDEDAVNSEDALCEFLRENNFNI